MNKKEFIETWRQYECCDEEVIKFIANILYYEDDKNNSIYNLFSNGYCYYFAVMLKTAFNRGEICWCAPYAHFIWLDTNGIPYDIEGVSTAEANYYIPEAYITDGIADFKHVPGVEFGATKEYIDNAIKMYEKNIKKED